MPLGTSYEFETWAANQGGPIAYVWYCAGMPWAVSSRKVTLSTTFMRRMFGQRNIDAYGYPYPADSVQVFACMEAPGAWTIKLADTQSKLTGGDYTIIINDFQPGTTWTHTDREIFGLEGLHTSPDPRLDTGIRTASLAQSMDEDDGTIYFEGDWGDILRNRITARHGSSLPTYLWIGNECMATDSAIVDDGAQAFHVGVERGVWRTRAQHHARNYADTGAILVSDCPLGGINSGRPCYLYAIPVDDDGNPLSVKVAQVSHGMVYGPPEYDAGRFKLRCSSWQKTLDRSIRVQKFEGQPRGYWVSRGDSTTQDYTNGHLFILEESITTDNWYKRKIWLCAEDDDKYFEDWTQLKEAIQSELYLMEEVGAGANTDDMGYDGYGSDGTRYGYLIGEDGIRHEGSAPTGNRYSFVGGPLAWILGLGPPDGANTAGVDLMNAYNEFYITGGVAATAAVQIPESEIHWAYLRRVADTAGEYQEYGEFIPDTGNYGKSFRAEYAYQYGWYGAVTDGVGSNTADVAANATMTKWPHTACRGGDGRFYVDTEYNLELVNTDDDLYLGSTSFKRDGMPTLCRSSISSVDTSNRYIDIGATSTASYFGLANLDHLKRASASNQVGPFRHGGWLYFNPGYHNGDPWRLSQKYSIQAPRASLIFKALLGDPDSTLSIPGVLKFWHVQDGLDESVDLHPSGSAEEFFETIDWDSFDEHVSPVFPGQYYELEIDDEINFASLMSNELRLHGVSPTWEYDFSSHQFVMRFRKIGVASPSLAYQGGRTLDETDRLIGKETSFQLSGDWLFNIIKASMQYSTANSEGGKYLINVNVRENDGYEILAGQERALEIQSKMTKIGGLTGVVDGDGNSTLKIPPELQKAISTHFVLGTLAHAVWPVVECSAETNALAFLKFGVGTEILVTDPTAINAYGLGSRGLTNKPALCSGMTFNPATGTTKTSYRLSQSANFNIAPSCEITASSISGDDAVNVTTTTENEFNTTFGRNDVSYFADYRHNTSLGGDAALDTNDTFYVSVFQRSTSADPRAGDGGLLFEGVAVTNVNIATRTCTLTLTDIGLTWDESATYVMVYDDWDSGNLADSQELWNYLADSDGILTDSGANVSPARKWE